MAQYNQSELLHRLRLAELGLFYAGSARRNSEEQRDDQKLPASIRDACKREAEAHQCNEETFLEEVGHTRDLLRYLPGTLTVTSLGKPAEPESAA